MSLGSTDGNPNIDMLCDKEHDFSHKNCNINDLLINDFLMIHTTLDILYINWSYQYSLFIKIITFIVKISVRHVILNLLNWIIIWNRLKSLIVREIRCFVIYCPLCINMNSARVSASLQSGIPLFQTVPGTCLLLPRASWSRQLGFQPLRGLPPGWHLTGNR